MKKYFVLFAFLFAFLFFSFNSFSAMVSNEENSQQQDFFLENEFQQFESEEDLIYDILRQEENFPLGFQGYLVEFEEEPVLVKKIELEKRALKNKGTFVGKTPVLELIVITPEEVPGRLERYSNKLEKNNEKIKLKISEKVSEKEIVGEYKNSFNGIALNVSASEINEIEKIRGIKRVTPNYEVKAMLMDSVSQINADDVWLLDEDGNNCDETGKDCLTGKGVTIGIIDTGVDYTHGDLGGCLGEGCKVIGGYDFVNNDNDPMDDHGHGTHCAGIAAGNGVLKGLAPDAQIYAYKVLDSGGSGYSSNIIFAIERSVDPNQDGNFSDHLDVISMSLGGFGNPDDPLSLAVDNAVDNGVIAVIAAGNDGPREQTIGSPGTARKAITVGAVDKNNNIAGFSSRGPVIWEDENGEEKIIIKPDIIAPGVDICAAQYDSAWDDRKCLDDSHVAISGTSMATPHVAGAVALLKQKNPLWTPEEIKASLKGTAVDLGYEVNEQGYGEVDVLETVGLEGKPLIAEFSFELVDSEEFLEISSFLINSEIFDKAIFFYKDFEKEEPWKEICSSELSEKISCSLDLKSLEDSEYIIKLVLYKNGLESNFYNFYNFESAKIKSPLNLYEYDSRYDSEKVIHRSDEPIIIDGTAKGFNFEKYELFFCLEGYASLSEGCSLISSSNKKVENNFLGVLNLPESFSSGFYEIVLRVSRNGKEVGNKIKIYIETDLQEGWPINYPTKFYSGGELERSPTNQPTIVDVDNDGKKDLVFAYGKIINVLNYKGESLKGWPVEVGVYMQHGVSVADINNDGFMEIVTGGGFGVLHVLNHDGSYVFDPFSKSFGESINCPVISDINNDGNLDIIFSDYGSTVWVVDYRGNSVEGWPKILNFSQQAPNLYQNLPSSAISIADINNDSYKELFIIGSLQTGGLEEDNLAIIFALDSKGNNLEGWPKSIKGISPNVNPNIILADLNNDKALDILVGLGNGTIYAWNLDATNLEGWPISSKNDNEFATDLRADEISVADLNNDGNLEVLFTKGEGYLFGAGCLFVYDSLGKEWGNFPVCGGCKLLIPTRPSNLPIIANLDEDSEMEIITGSSGHREVNHLTAFYAFNDDGSIVQGFPKYLDRSIAGNVVPVGDLDNDGDNELFVCSKRGNMFVYDLPGQTGFDEWPQFQHDPQHTGNYHYKIFEPEPYSQSKIFNNNSEAISGNLKMILQKKVNGEWINVDLAVEQQIYIPAFESVDLNTLWNTIGVSAKSSGDYRIYVELFSLENEIITTSFKEFKVQ